MPVRRAVSKSPQCAALPGRAAKPTTSVPPKYRGPNGETWTGRGLPPRWLAALIAAGAAKESFLIKP